MPQEQYQSSPQVDGTRGIPALMTQNHQILPSERGAAPPPMRLDDSDLYRGSSQLTTGHGQINVQLDC